MNYEETQLAVFTGVLKAAGKMMKYYSVLHAYNGFRIEKLLNKKQKEKGRRRFHRENLKIGYQDFGDI